MEKLSLNLIVQIFNNFPKNKTHYIFLVGFKKHLKLTAPTNIVETKFKN